MRNFPFRPALGFVFVLSVLLPSTVLSQSRNAFNPEISFISDIRAQAGDQVAGDVEFHFEELEIAASAALNPFSQGALFLGFHDGTVEVEEGYVDFTALPGNIGLRAGQFLLDQGRFNRFHRHTYSFLDHPGVVTEFFGDEGFRGVGVNPTWLLGLGDVAVTFSGSVVSEEAHGHEEHHEEEEAAKDAHEEAAGEEARFLKDLTYAGRASAFFPISDVTNLDVGVSTGTRSLEPHESIRSNWFGVDAKLKWKPNTRQSFAVAGEFLSHKQDLEEDMGEASAHAMVAYVDAQFRKHWNLGALVETVQSATESAPDRTGIGVFAGYSLFEESTLLRFLVRSDSADGEDSQTSFQLQLVSSLGPHKPHQF